MMYQLATCFFKKWRPNTSKKSTVAWFIAMITITFSYYKPKVYMLYYCVFCTMCYSSRNINIIFVFEHPRFGSFRKNNTSTAFRFAVLHFSCKVCLNRHLSMLLKLNYSFLKLVIPYSPKTFKSSWGWHLQLVNFQLEARVERCNYVEGTVLMKGIHNDLLIWVCEEAALFSNPKWCNVLAVPLSIPQHTDDFELCVYWVMLAE